MISNVYFGASVSIFMKVETCLADVQACLAVADALATFENEMKARYWTSIKGPQAGDFSLVMIDLSGRYTVKLFGDVAYNAFLNVVAADADNPYFPKVYHRMALPKVLLGYTQLVLMERLYNDWESKNKTPKAFAAYYALKHSGNDFENVNRHDYGAAFDKALQALAATLRENNTRIKCDLNGRNMMFRENGELVITDPLAPKF